MTKKMLIDAANPEEVRVCVLEKNRVEDFDFESSSRKPLRGNIYLARVTRVEPSLQAAFVEYGGNRHGFLAFSEIHPDYYQIPVSDREAIQAAEAEEAELAAKLNLSAADDENGGLNDDFEDDETDADDENTRGRRNRSRKRGGRRGRKAASADREDAQAEAGADDENGSDNEEEAQAASSSDDARDAKHAQDQQADAVDTLEDGPGEDGPVEDGPVEDGAGDNEADAEKGDVKPLAWAAPRVVETDDDATPPAASDAAAEEEEEEEENEEEASDEDQDDDDDLQNGDVDEGRARRLDSAEDGEETAAAGDAEGAAEDWDDGDDAFVTEDTAEYEADDDDFDDDDEERAAAEVDDDDDSDENDDDDDSDEDDDEDDDEVAGETRRELMEQFKEARRKRMRLLRNYKIQEVVKRRQIILVQVVKEERGNKGAALTTYLSLAGRYCVLMPNTARGGGISRKIPQASDRNRLRRIVDSLDTPNGVGLIIRTAGAKRTKAEIKRDYDYLMRLWETIRSLTLKSIAPALIYEEASLIKRAIRDLYDKDIDQVIVEGEAGYREAKDFMKMLMPSHAKNVQPYKGAAPIFLKNGCEQQLDAMYQPVVRLKSGGYLVINQTEALIAVDVNSGKSTRERNIEQTALNTNIEAAVETARQCRLRDLAGLIVIDFIDMEEHRNNRQVEKRLKEALKADRARVQVGRISGFGLLEMSRQRRRSGIVDGTTQVCPTCNGAGAVRSVEMAALRVLRGAEAAAVDARESGLCIRASLDVVLYILNFKREWLRRIEDNHEISIEIVADTSKAGDQFDIERTGPVRPRSVKQSHVSADLAPMEEADDEETAEDDAQPRHASEDEDAEDRPRKRRRRRGRRRKGEDERDDARAEDGGEEADAQASPETESDDDADRAASGDDDDDRPRRRRRRGRRGGRRNARRQDGEDGVENADDDDQPARVDAHAAADEPGDGAPSPDSDIESDQATDSPASTVEEAAHEHAAMAEQRPNDQEADQQIDQSDDQPAAPAQSADEPAPAEDDAPQSAPEPEPAQAAAAEKSRKSRRGWWQRALGG